MLDRVCGVLDMDGFYVQKRFWAREAGFASVFVRDEGGEDFCVSRTFRIPGKVTLKGKDVSTVWYATNLIHGMSFFPSPRERCSSLSFLERFVSDCYHRAKTRYRDVVAYKGGSCERDLLDSMDVPHLNLETYGCPKFDVLIRERPEVVADAEARGRVLRCEVHDPLSRKFHCPRTEAFVFREWTVERFLEGW